MAFLMKIELLLTKAEMRKHPEVLAERMNEPELSVALAGVNVAVSAGIDPASLVKKKGIPLFEAKCIKELKMNCQTLQASITSLSLQ